jgi:hypothetical protein
MNCREFERTIIDFGYEHLLEVSEAASASAHAKTCEKCAALLNREQRMTAGLRGWAIQEAAINAPDRVRLALRAAFDRQQAAAASPPVSLSLTSLSLARHRWFWGLAAAAMLLLFTVTAVLWLREREAKGSHVPLISDNPSISPTPSVKSPEVGPQMPELSDSHPLPSPIKGPSGKQGRRRMAPVEKRVDDAAKLFPLTFVAKSGPAEFVQTVRVEISRSTLLLMGLPINMDRGEGRIKADLIIGEDGVARAVRILN